MSNIVHASPKKKKKKQIIIKRGWGWVQFRNEEQTTLDTYLEKSWIEKIEVVKKNIYI